MAEGSSRAKVSTIKEVAGKTFATGRSAMSFVSFEVAHALNQMAGRLGIPLRTHSPVARTFFCAQRAHSALRTLLMRVTHTHGVSVKRCLHMCRFSPSRFLPSHVSPVFAVP